MEDSVHSIVLHVGPNLGNPTHKSELALGLFQRNLLVIREAFRILLRDDVSTTEIIRPMGLDVIHSPVMEKFVTTNQIRLRILTTTHVWRNDRGRAKSRRGSRNSC